MEFSFRENQAYLLAKNVYRLILLHTQNENFKKNETLTRRIEKTSLCVISLIIADLTSGSDEEKAKSLSKLLHLTNSLYSLYDIALDLELISKKDLSLMESALNELLLEIKKL
jgi:hypothetical protein